jgi:hypothetical protein
MGYCVLKSSDSGLSPILTAFHTPGLQTCDKVLSVYYCIFIAFCPTMHHYFKGDRTLNACSTVIMTVPLSVK